MSDSTASTESHGHGEGHPEVGHVVSVKMLAGILGALLVLTVVTVAVSYVDAGPFNLAIALAVACVKAAFVVLFFMHLRWDKPFNAVLFVSTILFLTLFIGFTLLDAIEYNKDVDPTFGRDLVPQYEHEYPK